MSEKMRKIEGAGKTEEATSTEAKMKYEKPAVINLSQISKGEGVGSSCSPGSTADGCVPGSAARMLCSTGDAYSDAV